MVPEATSGDRRPCGCYRAIYNVIIPDRHPVAHLQDFVETVFGKKGLLEGLYVRPHRQVDIEHTDAVTTTTTAIILTSPPPLSPPPPLYAVDCLPVEEEKADSSAEYHRETRASHLPLRGGGDSPRNPLLLLGHIGDTERTKVKWTQTTSVVKSGDRIVQTQSSFIGMLLS
ncbi:hypothetical protein SprV_0200614400 [Sparganum proliferum]